MKAPDGVHCQEKISVFKQKLEFYKTCKCHYELNSFQIKYSSDEIDGKSNLRFLIELKNSIKKCVHI